MHQAFSFEDTGRVFDCHVERARARDTVVWWWFTVSSDNNRYAPFHADVGDTEDSVRSRVVAYYDALIRRRSEPRQPWRRPDKPGGTPASAPGADGTNGANGASGMSGTTP